MCRFTLYKGKSIPIGDIILYPNNSLVYQSRDATYHPGVIDIHCFRNIRVNGDGFGIGWYNEEENSSAAGCCLFKLTSPAWSNTNLRNIGQYVRAPVLFAHVRAASNNCMEPVIISDENCHPFKCGRYTFMHNGFIPNFMKMKRAMCMLLSEDTYKGILGSTDSEHIFALFLDMLPNKHIQLSSSILASTMEAVINKMIELCNYLGITDAFSCNVAVTDGINIIATRFRNNNHEEPPSLYYSFGSEYSVDEGNFKNLDESTASEVLISSAPLAHTEHYSSTEYSDCTTTGTTTTTTSATATTTDSSFLNDSSSWKLIPRNHILICVGDKTNITKVKKVQLKPILYKHHHHEHTTSSSHHEHHTTTSHHIHRHTTHMDSDDVIHQYHSYDITPAGSTHTHTDNQLLQSKCRRSLPGKYFSSSTMNHMATSALPYSPPPPTTTIDDSLSAGIDECKSSNTVTEVSESIEAPTASPSRKGDVCSNNGGGYSNGGHNGGGCGSQRRHSFSNPCLAECSSSMLSPLSSSNILSPLLSLGQNRMFLWSSATPRK